MSGTLCPVVLGRDAETSALREAIADARTGRGGVVFLVGDAGIGKSRLAREARAIAESLGMRVFAGRAVEGASVAYRALSEALRAGLRNQPTLLDDVSIEPFRPALARVLPETGTPIDASSLIVAEGVTRVLARAGRDDGSLLVLEDLHWSDTDTIAVLEYLADHLQNESSLCLATIRMGESYAVEASVRRLAERRAARVVHLGRLSPGDVERMLEACLDASDIPEDVRRLVGARAEGVPLFVEEMLATLVHANALVRDADGWRVEGAFAPTVPLTFKQTIERRIASLGDDARTVLHTAAVIGRRFEWSLLAPVTALAEEQVIRILRSATDAQLLSADTASGAFRFRHALTRDAVLSSLLPPELQRYAARAFEVLEATRGPFAGDDLSLAADLAERAGMADRAAELLLATAKLELARGAPASAEAALRRARQTARNLSDLTLDIDEAAAQAAALAGDVDRAVKRAERVIAALAWGGAPVERRGRLHLVLARAAVTAGRWADSSRHAHDALALALQLGDDALLARAEAICAQVAIAEQRLDDAEAIARSAIARAEASGVPEAACEALEVLGRHARLDDLDASERYFLQALAVAERHGMALWRARALHELGTIDLQTGRRRGWLEQARAAAVEAGAVATIALIHLHLCAIAQADWRPADARVAGERCVELSRRLGLSTYGMGLIHLAAAHAMLDDEAQMERVLSEALSSCADDVEVQAGASGRVRLMLALARADFDGALRALDEAMSILRAHPALAFPFRGIWALLRTIADRDGESARAEVRSSAGASNSLARMTIALADAVASGRAGRADDSEAALATAKALRTTLGPAWGAIMFALVGGAAAREGWGDGAAILRESLAVFEGAGLEPLASWCRAALRAAGEKVPRKGRGASAVPPGLRAAGVTSREADVLRLVAKGLSNREIGARLHLSARTVERHVSNLLLKTGGTDRKDLSRLALDHALRPSDASEHASSSS